MRALVADEERAARGWERLREAHPGFPWASVPEEGRALLDLLLGHSPYATNLLVRRGDLLRLFLRTPFPRPRGRCALRRELGALLEARSDWRAAALCLREVKQREVVKILARDLAGEGFCRTVAALTALAEALLEAALAWLCRTLFPDVSEEEVVVLGLGKLGGRELNYSSDVDLVYLYHGPRARKERYLALFRELTRLGDTLLDGDRLFRVDLRLRPGGKEGELAFSVRAARDYYSFQSHPFERLALLRARPVAGHRPLGKALLRTLRPVVFPRFLDYSCLEHIRDLKERIRREAARVDAAREVKIGPGGIREAEFFCQTLQMIYGGKDPSLRVRHTLWALRRLARAGLLPAEEAEALRAAYVFLRTVEHRLQTPYFRQTATLPEGGGALVALARSLGFDDPDRFLARLGEHRARVSSSFEALLAPREPGDPSALAEALLGGERPPEEVAREAGLPENLVRDLLARAKGRGALGRRVAPAMRRIVRELLPLLVALPERERSLARFLTFLDQLGGRVSLYHALAHHPERLRDLLEAFARSGFLTNLLREAPAAVEGLFRRAETPALAGLPTEEALGLLRSRRNEELLRLGLEDLRGRLPLEELLAGLSGLAREILDHTFSLAARDAGGAPSGLAVLGLGKLGSRELGYRSDLDLVFVSGGGDTFAATRVAQRLLHYLTVPLPEGPGYAVDTRLRPEGRKGPLVVSLEGFVDYHRHHSGLWEKLALVRVAPVAGDGALAHETVEAVRGVLAELKLGEEAARELREMRRRMEQERGRRGWVNLKVGPGGLADLEFVVQWLCLRAVREAGRLPGGPLPRVAEELEGLGLLDGRTREEIVQGYLFLRTLDQKLVLLLDRSGEEKLYRPEELEAAAPYLGAGVQERFRRITARNREIFERWLR